MTKPTTSTTSTPANAPVRPVHGEHAADLVYDIQADPMRGGLWIYPACYDDFQVARCRAYSLTQGFGIPFSVDLFGANGTDGEPTPSAAINEPGYYAFTRADPRPHVEYLPADGADEADGTDGADGTDIVDRQRNLPTPILGDVDAAHGTRGEEDER